VCECTKLRRDVFDLRCCDAKNTKRSRRRTRILLRSFAIQQQQQLKRIDKPAERGCPPVSLLEALYKMLFFFHSKEREIEK
jgi:uncharacterized protein YfbU (UPF0304 family)